MDIKEQAITEYLTQGTGYRKLAAKYGVSRTTINKWVMIHQGIHNIAPTEKQQKYYHSGMYSKPENIAAEAFKSKQAMEQFACTHSAFLLALSCSHKIKT